MWATLFRPLCKDGVTSFLDNLEVFPCDVTHDKMMDLVTTSEYWTTAFFDVKHKTLQKNHYKAMFLQMIAAKLTRANIWRSNLSWVICCGKETNNGMFPLYRYKDTDKSKGINLMPRSK